MNCSLRHNKHLNHNFRKLINYAKVEGFKKVSFVKKFVKKRLGTQKFDCKIGFQTFKIKRSPNVHKTFPQRLDKVIRYDCKKGKELENLIAKIGFLNVKIKLSLTQNVF